MARAKKYTSKATISTIAATSRASVKIKDNFFTVEYHEERVIPDLADIDIEEERKILWDAVNAEVDHQVEDICAMFKNKR